jgi:hypothetical protein
MDDVDFDDIPIDLNRSSAKRPPVGAAPLQGDRPGGACQ